jgi:stage III sporulation protein AG
MAENDRNKGNTQLWAGGIWQNIMKKFGQNPATSWILVAIAALGVILLLTGNDKGTVTNGKLPPDSPARQAGVNETYTDSADIQLADELARTLEKVEGVGRVQVKVNLKSRSRKIWERQFRESKRTSQEQNTLNTEEDTNNELVFAKDRNGYDQPVLKEELAPVVEGVIVVAEGARNIRIKGLLIDAVTTILGIPAHRVIVVGGNTQ